jgi:hypothetical protein
MTYLVQDRSGGSVSSMIEPHPEVRWSEAFGRLRPGNQSSAITAVFHLGEALPAQYDFSVLIPPGNQAALDLVESWLSDNSDYDSETWPGLREGLEAHRLSARSLFGE